MMNKSTWTYLRTALAAVLLQFVVFKLLYPYPGFFPDSYTYLGAAQWKDSVSVRPIGYSWFLYGVHLLSCSAYLLVFVQYLLLQAAGFYLFVSIRRLYTLSRRAERVFFVFVVFNPLFLYIGNCVSSDALFTSLGLIWFVELLWLTERPGWWRLARLSILLIMLFFVRYTALCCPIIAAVAFLLTARRKGVFFAAAGVVTSCLLVGLGVMLVRELTWRETGTRVFTAFSGWQIANNAIHIYPYISVDPADLPDAETRELDGYVKKYFEKTGPALRKEPMSIATTDYMWNEYLPLKRYYTSRRLRENTHYFTAWTRVGPVMTQYGYYLISRHPLLYFRYYLVPSAKSYFLPSLETLAKYNEGRMDVDTVAMEWFHWPSTTISAKWPSVQGKILPVFPWLYLGLNTLFFVALLLLLFWGRWRRRLLQEQPVFFRGFLLVAAYCIVHAAFIIYATASVFRYEVMALLLLAPCTWIYYSSLFSRGSRRSP